MFILKKQKFRNFFLFNLKKKGKLNVKMNKLFQERNRRLVNKKIQQNLNSS
jgi:hypothetical protein